MKLKINHTLLIQLLFLSLAGITAFQKISGLEIPEWFIHKFENSFINLIPFGITCSLEQVGLSDEFIKNYLEAIHIESIRIQNSLV